MTEGHLTGQRQEDGFYTGFDRTELTSRSGGKAAAARLIKVCTSMSLPEAYSSRPRLKAHNGDESLQEKYGYNSLVMVGDGATDLEARQPGGAEIFIGYGGMVERPSIAGKADWYIYDIGELITALS